MKTISVQSKSNYGIRYEFFYGRQKNFKQYRTGTSGISADGIYKFWLMIFL
jgi:hypothetical protein